MKPLTRSQRPKNGFISTMVKLAQPFFLAAHWREHLIFTLATRPYFRITAVNVSPIKSDLTYDFQL